jgi:hypothetical protein
MTQLQQGFVIGGMGPSVAAATPQSNVRNSRRFMGRPRLGSSNFSTPSSLWDRVVRHSK